MTMLYLTYNNKVINILWEKSVKTIEILDKKDLTLDASV